MSEELWSSMVNSQNTPSSVVSMTFTEMNRKTLQRLKRLNLTSYLSERSCNGLGVEFWHDSIIEFIGLEFPEKKAVAESILEGMIATGKFNWTKYFDAIADMIDSYFSLVSLMEFQEKFVRKLVNTTMKGIE